MQLKQVLETDVNELADLVVEYHEFEGIQSDRERNARVLMPLLSGDSSHGRVWFIRNNDINIGYVAITFCYSIEFGGRESFIDEIFIRSSERGKGLGRKALTRVVEELISQDFKAIHLEVDINNLVAKSLYKDMGFKQREKYDALTFLVEQAQ